MQERIEMINNAMELSKKNILTGIGGNGWQYKYQEVQTYPYISQNVHSYCAKVILEFGIVGLIAYIGIGVTCIIIYIKAIKKQNIEVLSIIFAIFIIAIHSMIDMDMEYMPILIYIFGLIGIVGAKQEKKEKVKDAKAMKYLINGLVCIVFMTSIYFSANAKNYSQYNKISNLLKTRNGLRASSEEYQSINAEIAKQYEKIAQYERYEELNYGYNIVKYYLDSNAKNKIEILEKYYQQLKEYKTKNVNSIEEITKKIRYADSFIAELERTGNPQYGRITKKVIDIVLNEYDITKQQIEQYEQKQNINVTSYIEQIEEIKKKVKQIEDTYLLDVRVYNEAGIEISEEKLQLRSVEEINNILLYHTHGTESYKSDTPYRTYAFYKSVDEKYNVVKAGEYLTRLLQKRGIHVIHDKQYYNYPLETGSYDRARENAIKILKQHKNINYIIDIHRDAYSETETPAPIVKIGETEVAPLRFVISANSNNEKWYNNLKWAIEIQKLADKKYPGLFSPILIRNEDYNQDIGKYAILIEVGEKSNKIEQALKSVEYLAECITTLNE